MNHEEWKEKIFLIGDTELDAAERREIENHLKSCGDCRESLARWEKIGAAIKTAPSPASDPEAFARRVILRLEGPREGPGWFSLWRIPALGAALASVLFVVLLNLRQEPVSLDDLLLAGLESNGFSQWILEAGEPTPEEILEIEMEDL